MKRHKQLDAFYERIEIILDKNLLSRTALSNECRDVLNYELWTSLGRFLYDRVETKVKKDLKQRGYK